MFFTFLPRLSPRLCAVLMLFVCLLLAGKTNAQTPPPPALVVTHSFIADTYSSSAEYEAVSPSSLTQGSDGFFYGTTQAGGTFNGTVFKVRGNGSDYAVVSYLSYNADQPNSIIQGKDGVLYGTTFNYNGGAIFRVATDGSGLTTIHGFDSTNSSIDGITPSGPLVQGSDGYLYGATASGGPNGGGTLFKISSDGLAFIVIHAFMYQGTMSDSNGSEPSALTLGSNGVLYGTTHSSSTGPDTVFKINTDGSGFATLYTTAGLDTRAITQAPNGPLTFGADGALYGAMRGAGTAGNGFLFKIHTDGTGFTLLHSFAAINATSENFANPDGADPLGLIQAGDGYFYGTARAGGANGTGTVFQISPDGTVFRLLHTFGPPPNSYIQSPIVNRDGTYPLSALTVGSDGLVYGTASSGGLDNSGTVFRLIASHTHILWNKSDGTASVWSVDTNGAYTHAEYGPYPGWTATSVASGGDGLTRLLWNHASDGQIALWTLDASNGFHHQEYGPYTGWGADALTVGPDGLPQVLWNYTDPGSFGSLSAGTAALWDVDANGGFVYHDYGPNPNWTATAAAIGGDGLTHLLWNHAPDGQIALWGLTPATGAAAVTQYGPFAGWTAFALSAGADSVPHVLWNNMSGRASLWNVKPDTTYSDFEYGPYAGWNARGLATGPDNISRLLWDKTDGTLSLWALNNDTGTYTFQNYGPFPGWTAVAVSAGP